MLGVSEESAAINIKGQLSVTFHDSCNLELVLSAAMKEGSKEKVKTNKRIKKRKKHLSKARSFNRST